MKIRGDDGLVATTAGDARRRCRMQKEIEVFGLMGDPERDDETLFALYREPTESTSADLKPFRMQHDEWLRAREAGVLVIDDIPGETDDQGKTWYRKEVSADHIGLSEDGYVIEVDAERLVPAAATA